MSGHESDRVSRFIFKTDAESEEFMLNIVREMVQIFEISEGEAVVRVNDKFKGQEFLGYDMIYHETYDFWAKNIMYGHHSFWWLNEAEAQRLPLPNE